VPKPVASRWLPAVHFGHPDQLLACLLITYYSRVYI
jgi:hypothetical protein